jgi:hypothetical protein
MSPMKTLAAIGRTKPGLRVTSQPSDGRFYVVHDAALYSCDLLPFAVNRANASGFRVL